MPIKNPASLETGFYDDNIYFTFSANRPERHLLLHFFVFCIGYDFAATAII
jgi:hypothetical protein